MHSGFIQYGSGLLSAGMSAPGIHKENPDDQTSVSGWYGCCTNTILSALTSQSAPFLWDGFHLDSSIIAQHAACGNYTCAIIRLLAPDRTAQAWAFALRRDSFYFTF